MISNSFLISELIEYYNAGGLETNEEIELSVLLRDQEAFKAEVFGIKWSFVFITLAQMEGLIQPFKKLEELKISSQHSNSTLMFLLLHCPSLVKLYIGGQSEITNETLIKVTCINLEISFLNIYFKILSFNNLLCLKELEISEANLLNRETFDLLLNNCTNLR